jgi:hypothetical protein
MAGQSLLGHDTAPEGLPGELHLLLPVEEGNPTDLVEVEIEALAAFINSTSDLCRTDSTTLWAGTNAHGRNLL